jgi:TonB family protein
MLRDKLQSGFLLLKTQRGPVRVHLSFWQRLYLLWTFRNFRQLSLPLLNSRQRAMVNTAFDKNARVVSDSYDRSLVIGAVEFYLPPKLRADAAPVPLLVKNDTQERQAAQPAKIAAEPNPAASALPIAARSRFPWPKIGWSRLATTGGVAALCVVSVVAWHRIEGIPNTQAHSQPRLQGINAIAPSNVMGSAKSSPVAGDTVAGRTTAVTTPLVVPKEVPKAEITPASIATVVPTPMPTAGPTPKPSRLHGAASIPTLPLSGKVSDDKDSGIPATRPPLHFAYPDYPDVHARGIVALTAQVDPDGVVRTVKVVSGNRALAAVAVRAVRQWRYRPYLKDGRPVATETNIVISFISDDAISMSFPPSLPPTP